MGAPDDGGSGEKTINGNRPVIAPKNETEGSIALITAITVVLGAAGGAMGAIQGRGFDEPLSGIIPGILAAILSVEAYFLVLGGIKDSVSAAFVIIALMNSFLVGLLGSVSVAFYSLPGPLMCGLMARVIWPCLVSPSESGGKHLSQARSSGLWDREMDGNRR
jgi:hypothetical protein